MSKKNFKDNTANIDRFFSEAQNTSNTQNTDNTTDTVITQEKPYRINLKLRPKFRKYLDDEAWKARTSITEYLNELIQADMDNKNGNKEQYERDMQEASQDEDFLKRTI